MTWKAIHDTLQAMFRMRDNFDGQGSEAPDHDTIETAQRWAEMFDKWALMPAPTRVHVGCNANIFFEWQGNNSPYREIEFERDGAVHTSMVPPRGGGKVWRSGHL